MHNAENLWEKNLHKIIEKIGAKPHYLTAQEHDKIYALVSHLPQYLSFLSNASKKPADSKYSFLYYVLSYCERELDTNQLSSLFFQRCFRLNNSDRDLWQEIFDLNQKNFSIFFQEWKGNFDIISKIINNAKNPFKILRTYLVSDPGFSLELDDKFYKDFNNNRENILYRLAIVIAYLEIKKIQDYKKYAGKGFADFTSIIKILSASEDVWLNQVKNQ
jgi:prephenate dehydrogenase